MDGLPSSAAEQIEQPSPLVLIIEAPKAISDLDAALLLLGRVGISLHDTLCILASLFHHNEVDLPAGKNGRQARGRIAESTLADVRLDVQDGAIVIQAEGNSFQLGQLRQLHAGKATELMRDSMVLGKALAFLKNLAAIRGRFTALLQTPTSLATDAPCLLVSDESERVRRDIRRRVDGTVRPAAPYEMAREIQTCSEAFKVLRDRRGLIQQALRTGDLRTRDRLPVHALPRHPLMPRVKQLLDPCLAPYQRLGTLDPLDLKYQVLFRLTTLPLSQVFDRGQELEAAFREAGAEEDWEALSRPAASLEALIASLQFNPDVVSSVIDEQLQIIEDRLRRSSLPLRQILQRDGLFQETGYVVCHGREGALFAARESKDDVTSCDRVYPLQFRQVDPAFARQVHQDLHYIHTPRASLAFALFLEGDPVPFSVLAFDEVTRPYKQDALLASGFPPNRCLDLTRLYTCPGSPGNTSSFIFSLAFEHLRRHRAECQAVLSAFMPSYASGVSMTSSGFTTPLLMKKSQHCFARRQNAERELWEYITPRRGATGPSEHRWPLLPVVELLCQLQEPRFEPLPEVTGKMFRFGC